MITASLLVQLQSTLPMLHSASESELREFQNEASLSRLAKGRDVFIEGDTVDSLALVLTGSVRVYKIGETGREITLYRFGTGEACILTANAILSRQTFPAIATVEQDTEAIMISADTLRAWIVRYEPWRVFIFGLLAQRLSTVMMIVDEVAFRRLDARIAEFILTRSAGADQLSVTHQQIAAELGSTREVISRILEDLADARNVVLERGLIRIVDADALRERAAR